MIIGNLICQFIDPNAMAEVYNRWGQLVASMGKGSVKWDGTDKNGQPLPDDGYHYIIIANGKVIRAGGVTILR